MSELSFVDKGDEIVLLDAHQEQIGEVTIMDADGTMVITHTGVSPDYRGKGLAGKLVLEVVKKARQENRKIFPICPFAVKFFKASSDYDDVLRSDV